MDKFLKLKLEMVYRGIPVEQARQQFDQRENPELPLMGNKRMDSFRGCLT
jgi:hypothetical protein